MNQPGFAALSLAVGAAAPRGTVGGTRGGWWQDDAAPAGPGLRVAVWGEDAVRPSTSTAMLLCGDARSRDRQLGPEAVRRVLTGPDQDLLPTLMPPFAAATLRDAETLVAATDALGFRHLYSASGPGWAAVSTSARALAALVDAPLNREALAVQTMLGWQLGTRTLFEGVTKVRPGGLVTLAGGYVVESAYSLPEPVPMTLGAAVVGTRDMLRGYLEAYLDDHPDAVLQLTGGQDSRLLLSAIPPSRRSSVAAMTLGPPDSADRVIAAALARRCGLKHETLTLDGLEELSPGEAHELCLDAAARLELMADPLATAALDFAELRANPGRRISGLGGEVARGFYYLGPVAHEKPTMRRTLQLTRWRMFVNDAVTPDALEPEFRDWARDFTTQDVHRILSATGRGWSAATDDLYLEHRMQRWAGGTETAVCTDRVSTNPMLDDRFLGAVRGLAPEDKRNSRFLARLQVALDEDLARIPLDGRPAPATMAEPGLHSAVGNARGMIRRGGRKVTQRLSGKRRPPVGGAVLGAAVVRHWRERPQLLESVAAAGLFRQDWLAAVVDGSCTPEPSAVALLINLGAALAGRTAAGGTPSYE
jgi:asparagine synthase (glutamine-hydrolysing)